MLTHDNRPVSRSRASGPAGVLALSLLLTACGDSSEKSSFDDLPIEPLPVVAVTPSPTTAPALFPTEAPSPSPSPEPTTNSLPNGRHPALLTGIDVAASRITIDVVQFFTGTAASTAAAEDGATEVPPPNDYWVRNSNPLLRTLMIAPDARITVNTLAGEETGNTRKDVVIDLRKLASYPSLAGRLFWLTVSGNTVTVLTEQFLP